MEYVLLTAMVVEGAELAGAGNPGVNGAGSLS